MADDIPNIIEPSGKPGNPYVTGALCNSYRAHIETKIGDMEKSIRWSIYLASAGMGMVIMFFQYYLAVIR